MDWSQEKRPFRLYTPLGKDVLLLTSFNGSEHISRFFRFSVLAYSKRGDIEAKDLLLKPVHLALRLPDNSDRTIYGIVSQLSRGGMAPAGYTAYELEILPSHWVLDLDTGFAIFQTKSARDICEDLLKGTPHDWKLLRTLEPRPYCFRYRESRWNVIARLLEQEGIWFRYDHKSGEGKLILADSVASAQPAWGVTTLQYNEHDIYQQRLIDLRVESSPFVSQTKVRTYSEFLPTQDVGNMTAAAGTFTPPGDVQAYRFEQQMTEHRTGINHSGGLTPADVAKLPPDTKVYSRIRQEMAEATAVRYAGESRYTGLEVGAKSDITDHPIASMNGSVFITSVTHSGYNGSYEGGDENTATYTNRFEAIPSGTPYRPPRITPWPHVGGSHVGVVVGPPGEEIYTDKHGRVQVVFKWDRDNSSTLDYSCWIRVAQSFAGNRYGMVFLPRVGHEVMVEFLDGNPDNPIVVGSLYNAQNLPPWELPEHKTQTGVRTHSTLKGGPENYNELRFEDKIKEEQIYVQAEKDLDTLVKNNETRLVKNNRTTTIVNNDERTVNKGHDFITIEKGERVIKVLENTHSLYVNKDSTIVVDASETTTVAKDRSVTVKGKQDHTITGNDTIVVEQGSSGLTVNQGNISVTAKMGNIATAASLGNITIKANAGSITLEAMQKIELKVGGNSIVIDQTGVTIKGIMVKVEGQAMATVKAPMTQISGDAMVVVKGAITMIN